MESNIPEGVEDEEAYSEYLKLSRHPILTKKKEFEASDGTKINLAAFVHLITKRVEHLPVAEQNSVLTKKDLYTRVNNKLTAVKRKAFGQKQGGKNKEKGSSTLLGTRQTELIEYFGRMFSTDEVHKLVNKEWGLPVSIHEVKKFRAAHGQEIEKRIEVFKASYSDIRLGVKRSRLEELTYLYGRAKEKYLGSDAREDYKLLLSTLEHIRKESEGDRLTIEGKVDVSYEANMHAHLRSEVYKSLNLKEIILGRVAARMGISPVKLIYSLNNSFYNQFSNVTGEYDEEAVKGKEMTYPSQMNYDFERIKREAGKRDIEIEDAIIVEEKNSGKDAEKASSIKEAMLKKIKEKKERMEKMKADVETNTVIADKAKKKDSNKFVHKNHKLKNKYKK